MFYDRGLQSYKLIKWFHDFIYIYINYTILQFFRVIPLFCAKQHQFVQKVIYQHRQNTLCAPIQWKMCNWILENESKWNIKCACYRATPQIFLIHYKIAWFDNTYSPYTGIGKEFFFVGVGAGDGVSSKYLNALLLLVTWFSRPGFHKTSRCIETFLGHILRCLLQ